MKVLSTLSCFFIFISIQAQQIWSLEDCIDYALKNNISLKQSELNIELNKNQYLQSKMELLHSINSSNSFSAVVFKGKNPEGEYLLLKQPDTSGLLIEYKTSFTNTKFSLQTGILQEPKGFLGSSLSGAFGSIDESDTYFSGFEVLSEFSNFYTRGSLFYGKTDTNFNKSGLISNLDGFKSSSFSLGLFSKIGFGNHDSFGIQIDHPLRLEEGRMDLSVPVARTKSRIVLFEDYSMDISPSGRELDFKFIYNWPFASGLVSSRVGYVKDSNHFSNQEDQFYFSTNIEYRLSE